MFQQPSQETVNWWILGITLLIIMLILICPSTNMLVLGLVKLIASVGVGYLGIWAYRKVDARYNPKP